MNEVKTIFKAAFALLGVMTVATVIADRLLDRKS